MQIRLKMNHKDGVMRVENKTVIREIMINEDLLHPEKESISLCFKNDDSSGIIDLSIDEFENLHKSVKGKLHLIKGQRIFGGSGAYVFEKKKGSRK